MTSTPSSFRETNLELFLRASDVCTFEETLSVVEFPATIYIICNENRIQNTGIRIMNMT